MKINSDKLLVTDHSESNIIHIFSKPGVLIRSYMEFAEGTEYISISFDLLINIIVGDLSSRLIQIFSSESGQLIHKVACKDYMRGIAVTDKFEIICV